MKKTRYSSEAVLLKRVKYSEADLVVTFLTKDSGKLSGLAKHAMKSRKRFGNILSSVSLLNLDYTASPGRDLVMLEKGSIIRSFDMVADDVYLLALAGHGLELTDNFCPDHDPLPSVFELLVWYLLSLDDGQNPQEMNFIFHLRLLALSGFAPNISSCGLCGKIPDPDTAMFLSSEQGGLVCQNCRKRGIHVSPGSLKLMELVMTLPLDKVRRARISLAVLSEVSPFLEDHTRQIIGKELKSTRFLLQMKKMK